MHLILVITFYVTCIWCNIYCLGT